MATPPGNDQTPEATPRKVVYRRIASETRTVEVTSTTPWTKDLLNDAEKQPLTISTQKEELDKVLKWTRDQQSGKCQADCKATEIGTKSINNEGVSQNANQDIIPPAKSYETPTSEKATSKLPLNMGSTQTERGPNVPFAGEASFGGRRLSLAQRDKVVGGTAMMFAEPIVSREKAASQDERRKSEYDVGRLSTMSFAPSLHKRFSEPKGEKDSVQSSNVSKEQPDKFSFLSDSKISLKSFPTSENARNNEQKKVHSSSDEPSVHHPPVSADSKCSPNPFPRSENAKVSDQKNEKEHIQSTSISSATDKSKVQSDVKTTTNLYTSSDNIEEKKNENDKKQFSSNVSGFNPSSDKGTHQTDHKGTLYGNTSFSRSENVRIYEPKIEKDSSTVGNHHRTISDQLQTFKPTPAPNFSNGNSSTVNTENTRITDSKCEKDKVKPEGFQKPTVSSDLKNVSHDENPSSKPSTSTPDTSKTHLNNSSLNYEKPIKIQAAVRSVSNQPMDELPLKIDSKRVPNDNNANAAPQPKSHVKISLSHDNKQSNRISTTNGTVPTLSSNSNYLDVIHRPTSLRISMPDIVPGTSEKSLNSNGKSSQKPVRFSVSAVNSKAEPCESKKLEVKGSASSSTPTTSTDKSTTKNLQITPIQTTVQDTPSNGHPATVLTKKERRINETNPNNESDRSKSATSPKTEPPASSGEPLAVRPVTRSKSDVGEGNKGRTPAAAARKSCAERRCCGARQRPSQEAVPPTPRARSLSRTPPMGSSASLTPKNKSSWTTQRALEAEVQQLKRELQMHKAEELRLHREIHKLRSVLQQATSFGEEAAGTAATGDPDDGALLISLQERHGMAGAAGLVAGASKKQGVSGESCEPESIEVPRHEKDMRSRQLIKAAILDNDFLKNLARCQIRELVDCMYPQRVQHGSYVIREGEAGSHLYVLADGEMEVLKEGTVLGRMGPGKAFGELAILYNCTRTASIRAVSDLQVWVLDRRAFQQIMMRTGMQRLEDNIAFLRSVPLLRGINEQTLTRIADALEPEFYPAGEYIVRQGARGNTFFIISGGSVQVTQRGASGEEVVLRTLERGEYFGEQALLHDDCRTASVEALPPGVDCLTLDRESFSALIGSLSELHHKDYAEDTRSQTSRTSFTNDNRKEDYEAVSSITLEDLRPLGTLGVGGFGCVRLVMAPNGRSYALKCLSKRHVAATGQQEHVGAERDVLLAARSRFIVRLFRTFRDDANVYLLLEACLGGEVWALLREHERLPDKAARFVAACVLEALEYLHARDIVYRDLKPENLVMDANGYVKLVDFGFCKRLPVGCKTWTFCGTPEYVAPEVILNRGHDRAVDYWALGVLIYELLTGAPPFAAADPMGTYNLILLGMESAIMPKYISRPATYLIRRLCRAAPSERIGYQRGGFREVKAHRWFQDLDWDALRAQTMTPPIKPQVSGPTDMSNFYAQPLDEELPPAELSHWDADF